jgi:hypothetical protein
MFGKTQAVHYFKLYTVQSWKPKDNYDISASIYVV